MAMSKSIISKTRLANHEQETIFLIEQQLKIRRFFDDLDRIGLGHYDFEPNLDHLILKNVNLDDGLDETYAYYTRMIEKHSKQLRPDRCEIERQANRMYRELQALKKELFEKRKWYGASKKKERI